MYVHKKIPLSHPPCFVLSNGIPRAQGCGPTSVPKAAHETWLPAILQWPPAGGSLCPGSAGGSSPGHTPCSPRAALSATALTSCHRHPATEPPPAPGTYSEGGFIQEQMHSWATRGFSGAKSCFLMEKPREIGTALCNRGVG